MIEVKKIEKSFDITIDNIASDKSISHRCAIFALLSDKPSIIKNYLKAEDTLNSLKIATLLGARVEELDSSTIKIFPPKQLKEPFEILDCGNSGTTIRIYSGLLSAIDGFFVLTGDIYLRKRPMKRVIAPLNDIGADIDAKSIFQKGLNFGQTYTPQSDYIILAESVPSGTTTALATALALGYDVKGKFSSSFKNVPNNIKQTTIQKALNNIKLDDDIFDILSKVSDNMLIFNAGFILGLNNKLPLILAGGTQMACVLLIVDKILQTMGGHLDTSNLALATTKWVYDDKYSDINGLLNLLSFDINSYYSDFDFSLTNHPALKLYDDGEAKEGVGAGASLAYGVANNLTNEQVLQQIQYLIYNM